MFRVLPSSSPHLAKDTGDSTGGTFRNHPLLPNNRTYVKSYEIFQERGKFRAFGAS